MVFLALEPKSVSEAIRLATSTGWSVWVGSDAITQEEHYRLCDTGLRITRLSYPLSEATQEVIADTVETIGEHHPSETIWVQSMWQPPPVLRKV
jgi:hypothetical protein